MHTAGRYPTFSSPPISSPHALNSSHFPQAGTRFFKQIRMIFAAPQKLSPRTLRGRICDRRAEKCLRRSPSGRKHCLDRRALGPIPECRPRACQFRFAGFADKFSIPRYAPGRPRFPARKWATIKLTRYLDLTSLCRPNHQCIPQRLWRYQNPYPVAARTANYLI